MKKVSEEVYKMLSAESAAVQKVRDLSIIPLSDSRMLVIACDSNASIGEKSADYRRNTYEEVAVSALKVPFMEVLATGAEPLVVVDNLCVEMDGAGKRIIANMRQELCRHGFGERVQLTGSTEDNMSTTQTALGVTVIGMLDADRSRIGQTRPGDLVVCIGVPRSGVQESYSEFQPDVANIGTVKRLVETAFVHELLPIGSKGAAYEAEQLCKTAGLRFQEEAAPRIDTRVSAGSSTAVLCSICPDDYPALEAAAGCPCCIIGKAQPDRPGSTK